MGHVSIQPALRPWLEPPDAALGDGGGARVEVTRDGARIRAADAASVRREPLVAHRAQVFRIRVEDVLATDLPRRVEERETDADGDLEQGALLAIGLGDETLINGCQLRRGREALRVLAQVGQRALEPLELERRDVDETCGRPARALERGEQVVDGRELGLLASTPAAFSSETSASR